MAKIMWFCAPRVLVETIVLLLFFFMNVMKLHDKVLTHKYIDDITLTESLSATNKGHLQEAVHTVKEWSDKNNMRLNETKTKEMLI